MGKPTRLTENDIKDFVDKGYWGPDLLSDVWLKNSQLYPYREALKDSRTSLTWSETNLFIARIALGLLSLGLKKDDLVVVQLPNSVELVLIRMACERAGLLFLPLLRSLREREIEQILSITKASSIVIPLKLKDFDHLKMIEDIRTGLPSLKFIIIAEEVFLPGVISLNYLMNHPWEREFPADYLEQTKFKSWEFSMILPTTGSTGFPKFVETPIAGMVYSAKIQTKLYGFTGNDVFALLGPAAGGPNMRTYICAPAVGAKIVMLEIFDAEEALKLIEREKVTVAGLVPAQLSMMLNHPNFNKYKITTLWCLIVAAASLPYSLAVEAEEKLGCQIFQGYGTTDWGSGTITYPGALRRARLLTVGRTFGDNKVKIVDQTGKKVPQGEVGEIWGSGPATASGYYKDPEATWKAWTRDGWFKTGDLGKIDEEGNLVVVGREKEIIIRGGQNIYPVEIENLLREHSKIKDVALVRMPDKVLGEKACAYIVPAAGETISFEDMISFLKGKKISSYKIPQRLELVDKMPIVGEQKIDRRTLEQDIIARLKKEGSL